MSLVVHPRIQWLFHKMADQVPGNLSVARVLKNGARLRYERRGLRTVSFSLFVLPGLREYSDLVEVRAPRQPAVYVSALPSAVLAVALR